MREALKLLQEAVLFRFRQRFIHLILHVTTRCNFRCNHCFVDFTRPPDELNLDQIARIAETFPDLLWLDIGGGEPFLRDDLDQILALFKAQEYSIPTNGWMTDRILESLERISRSIDLCKLILTISLDGLGATHDAVRNKPGSFERVQQTYRAVTQRFPDLRVKFNTVVSNHNMHEVLPLLRMVKDELNPSFHSILFLRGTPQNPEYHLPDTSEIRRLEDEIVTVQNEYHYGRTGILARVQRNYQALKRELDNAIVERKEQVIPCLAGRAHAVIYPDGGMAPCELLPEVGNVTKTPPAEILASEAWAKAAARIKAGRCHCTHDCNMLDNILFNFGLYPELFIKPRHRS